MTQRRVKYPPLAIAPLPHLGHGHTIDPVGVVATKGGRGQHLVGGIDMHVVLLGMHGEIVDPLGDGIIVISDVDGVVDDIARMSHPLAADHKLVVDTLSERVAHAPVPAGDVDAPQNRL